MRRNLEADGWSASQADSKAQCPCPSDRRSLQNSAGAVCLGQGPLNNRRIRLGDAQFGKGGDHIKTGNQIPSFKTALCAGILIGNDAQPKPAPLTFRQDRRCIRERNLSDRTEISDKNEEKPCKMEPLAYDPRLLESRIKRSIDGY